MEKLSYRQVHLDFHTSECIPDIGAGFDKKEFTDTLKNACVDSVTVFAKCHHGWSYYPSKVNAPHPGLKINLLGQQLEALKETGIRAPVYISAGLDEKFAVKNHDCLVKWNPEGDGDIWATPHYHLLCFNTRYLDHLLKQVREVMEVYTPVEIFLDICDERVCYCDSCLKGMRDAGLDPEKREDAVKWSRTVYKNYCDAVEKTVREYSSETAIFHNAGNIPMGRRDFAAHDSHLELESLPTGGWGYDHFPMSAAYARTLGPEYLGMTGKFHTTWGEFGGYKHPNALIYESSLSLAHGAKCSVGDQLHPSGKINASTYALIGKAYSQVEKKEKWCRGTSEIADIGVLSSFSLTTEHKGNISSSDAGANRILMEKNYLYNFIDRYEDFGKYKLIIIPDDAEYDEQVKAKLDGFLAKGGKLLASGNAGKYLPGITVKELRDKKPDYMKPVDGSAFTNGSTEYVMYSGAYNFTSDGYETAAGFAEPYFNRTTEHFSSHQHAPDIPGSFAPGAVINENCGYISWKIFEDYATLGELHCKELAALMTAKLLGDGASVKVNGLPDRGVVTLRKKNDGSAEILHLLYAHTCVKGKNTEVIEDTVPLYNVGVSVKTDKAPSSVTVVPCGEQLNYEYNDGILSFTVPKVDIHAMVEIK